jgi:predicted enzyme related to lactoylglutathione lyase
MDKVGHFEIPADNLERAKKFYKEVFDWQIHNLPEADFHNYHSIVTVPTDHQHMPQEVGGINGGLYKRSQPNEPTTIVIEVPSIDQYLEKIKKAGGSVVLEKQQVATFGAYARVKDTEGNLVGLWERLKD